jgi:tripartite-type tricarboxylate transporter receptor subunit TctC
LPAFLNRRHLLALGAACAAPLARGAAWPDRPIRFIVPSAPTTPADTVTRALGDVLHARLGQPIVIDNRPGAQGFIGLEAVVKSPPDGYTFGLLNIVQAIIPAMRSNVPFRIATALQPIVQLTTEATVLVVSSALPFTTVTELLAHAKQNPGKLAYGSSGNGSPSHVGMELLRRAVGIEVQHVPYRSPGAVLNDMAGGQLQLALLNSAAVLQALPTGRIRPLAVSADKRLARLPQVPTLPEAGVTGVDLRGWVGVVAPAGIDAAIAARMNAEINQALLQPPVQERLRGGGSEPVGGSVRQFAGHVAAETERWGKVVAAAGIRMD